MEEKVINYLKEKVLVGEYEITTCDEMLNSYFVVVHFKGTLSVDCICKPGISIATVNNFKNLTVHFTVNKEVIR